MYCKDNWFTFYFNEKNNLILEFNKKGNSILSVEESARHTAEEIYELHKNRDLYVAMSGGVDSEFVAKSLKLANIPFKGITLTSDSHFSFGEWYVSKWCSENNVELIKYEIPPDILFKIFLKRANKTIQTRSCIVSPVSLIPALLADIVSKNNGYLISGAMVSYHPDKKKPLDRCEPELSDFKGFMIDTVDVCIEFFRPNEHPWNFLYWSPEMLASIVNKWDTNLSAEENKWNIFGVLPRPKLTGAEIYSQNTLANKIPDYYNKYILPMKELFDNSSSRDFYQFPDKDELLKLLIK